VRVRAGSAYEREFAGSGISHYVEHMIFKGTKKRRPGQIEKEIRSAGGSINGATSYEYTSFTITIPNEHLPTALDILSDSLFNADMDKRESERERGVILKEIMLNKDNPMRFISRLLWASVYKTHPYRYPIIGHASLFIKLTRRDLKKYHRETYIPNNMVIVIAGDIENDTALKKIERYFGHIERRSIEDRPLPQEKPQVSKRRLEVEREVNMAYFALGYRGVDLYSPDMPALDLLSFVLGQGANSRLNDTLYRKKGLVYSIGCWNYTPLDPGVFIISGVADPGKAKRALVALKEELENIARDEIDNSELERAKKMIYAEHIYSLEALSDQARDLALNEFLTGDFNFTKEYLSAIDAVTKEELSRVAKEYLNDASLSIVTISPITEEPQKVKKEKRDKKDIQKFSLPNGLQCLLMEDHDLPIVTMLAVCLGGLRAETADTAGISNLTGLTMIKETESRPEEEISSLVENMGAHLTFFSGHNSVGIKFDLLSKDFDEGFELLKEIMLNPGFAEDIVEREKKTVIASINATEDNIFESGMRAFKETLYKKHPYRFQTVGNLSSVEKIRVKDLRKFYREHFIPNNMVLAIYGDIDSTKLKELLNKSFSGFEKGGVPEFTNISEPDQSEIRENIKKTSKEQSLILLGYKGTRLKSRDRYTLQLISTALSGITGRLAARLREELGLAYAVGSVSVPALDPGYFIFYVSTGYNNIQRAKNEFLRQIKLLNKKGLTDEEIESAKKELVGNHRIALQTNSALAYQTALDELYGLGCDHYKEFDKAINSITNQDILDVSRKYLKPDAFTLVIIEGKRGE
ncbi:MAG: insulinase family protein, partial [Candidatus Omnitrophica bacterium]|nr:insulinase family protein [Candidatus Omnitrophota bacterium]